MEFKSHSNQLGCLGDLLSKLALSGMRLKMEARCYIALSAQIQRSSENGPWWRTSVRKENSFSFAFCLSNRIPGSAISEETMHFALTFTANERSWQVVCFLDLQIQQRTLSGKLGCVIKSSSGFMECHIRTWAANQPTFHLALCKEGVSATWTRDLPIIWE